VESESFGRYLDDGQLPADDDVAPLVSLREPTRSYVAALALLGRRVPVESAKRFLAQFLFHDRIEDLVVDKVAQIEGQDNRFVDERTRAAAAAMIPPTSRATLCRLAAEMQQATDPVRAADLWIEAGAAPEAVAVLEAFDGWRGVEHLIQVLRRLQ